MKKFFAGTVKGISATSLKATDLLSIELNANTSVEAITAATSGKKILELLQTALAESRVAYAITSPFNHVKETIANTLQGKFMDRINQLVDIVESTDDIENLNDFVEDGRISREVVEYVQDLVSARKAELETVASPVEPVVMDIGIKLTTEQVLAMMAMTGLVIGGSCKTAMGEGTVLGFIVGQSGTIVVLEVEGKRHNVFATHVQGNTTTKNEENVTMAKKLEVSATQTNKEVNVSMENPNVVKSTPSLQFVAPISNEEAKALVEEAVQNNFDVYADLTPEQRAENEEAKLKADMEKFQSANDEKSAHATVLASSSAAQALKAFAGTPVVKSNVVAAPAAKVAAPAVSNTNQTNGGNVQMTNNTQTQGARQGSAVAGAFAGTQVSGRQGSTPSLALNGMAVQSNSPALAAWGGINSAMSIIQIDEYVGRQGAGNRSFVWYLDEAVKYEGQIMTAFEIQAAGMKNEALGITDMKFYSPASVAGLWGREAREDDFLYVEVFFGQTSYEFRIKRGTMNISKDNSTRPYIYSTNIARKQASNGGAWFCEYVAGRREDKLKVVVQADGVVRLARTEWNKETRTRDIVAADAPFVQEVGGDNWVNQNLYGTKVGQAVFIQVMMLMDEVSGLKEARESK
jgi:hypothetical protein